MTKPQGKLILGEYRRAIDDRYRLTIPTEMLESWAEPQASCMLVKQRPGCLSLWRSADWEANLETGMRVVETKWQAGRLSDRMDDVQTLGRLLSTRHRPVQLAARGRLLIPEGFREFLGVEAGAELFVVGAAVCIEIWEQNAWLDCLSSEIPRFGAILDDLSR